jgi:hypothetical protein
MRFNRRGKQIRDFSKRKINDILHGNSKNKNIRLLIKTNHSIKRVYLEVIDSYEDVQKVDKEEMKELRNQIKLLKAEYKKKENEDFEMFNNSLQTARTEHEKEIYDLEIENINMLAEAELSYKRDMLDRVLEANKNVELIEIYSKEIFYLKNRSLWDRILNKQ